jgi:hypothetical protein
MLTSNEHSTHEHYTETPRHWSAHSETYTGADSLLTLTKRGWCIVGTVYREDVLHHGACLSAIYHITLERQNEGRTESVVITVISNPFLIRYLRHNSVEIAKIHHAQHEKNIREKNILQLQDVLEEEMRLA